MFASWLPQHCEFCKDAKEVFPDLLLLFSHCQSYHPEKISNPVVQSPSSATSAYCARRNATVTTTGATATQEEDRKPPPKSTAVMHEDPPHQSSFPQLNGVARDFIVNFNMFGLDMSVEEVAAISYEAKLQLTAYVPSQLYLTNHGKKRFKKANLLPGGEEMKKEEVDPAHARSILSPFYLQKVDAESKVSQFLHETRKLKAAIAKCTRETMHQALLSKVRLVGDGKYKSITSWSVLTANCATNADLQWKVQDLLNTDVYPKGIHSECRRDVLASQLTNSCGFVFNDGIANKDFISLHVSEIWSEISQKIKKKASKDCAVSA